jgi:hypothetical protein
MGHYRLSQRVSCLSPTGPSSGRTQLDAAPAASGNTQSAGKQRSCSAAARLWRPGTDMNPGVHYCKCDWATSTWGCSLSV